MVSTIFAKQKSGSPAIPQKIQSKLWIFIHNLGESGGARTLDSKNEGLPNKKAPAGAI